MKRPCWGALRIFVDRAHPAPFSVGEDYRGHELTRRIGDFGLGEVHPRALGRMEREDLVVSERDGLDHGPPRRWYSITAPGESYLESWSDSLARYQEEIGLFFALYEGAARPARGGMRG